MTVAYYAGSPRAATIGPGLRAHPAPHGGKGTALGMKCSRFPIGWEYDSCPVQGLQHNFSRRPTRHSYPIARCNRSRSPKTRLHIFSLPAQPRRKPPVPKREHPSFADVHNLLAVLTGTSLAALGPSFLTGTLIRQRTVLALSLEARKSSGSGRSIAAKPGPTPRVAPGQPGVRAIYSHPKTGVW